MKRNIVLGAIVALAATLPANAGNVPRIHASWAECMATATASDRWAVWDFECVARPDGTYELVWINVKRGGKK